MAETSGLSGILSSFMGGGGGAQTAAPQTVGGEATNTSLSTMKETAAPSVPTAGPATPETPTDWSKIGKGLQAIGGFIKPTSGKYANKQPQMGNGYDALFGAPQAPTPTAAPITPAAPQQMAPVVAPPPIAQVNPVAAPPPMAMAPQLGMPNPMGPPPPPGLLGPPNMSAMSDRRTKWRVKDSSSDMNRILNQVYNNIVQKRTK